MEATGEEPRGARHFALPLLFLAIAAFGGAIIEGAPADWGAIRLERMGVSPSASALALAIFMAGMLAGRMVGDHLTDRFGGARVLRAGTLLVTFGTLLGVIVSEPWAFATGLALAGIGTSGVIPLAFSAAGRMPGVSPGFGAATVSLTGAYRLPRRTGAHGRDGRVDEPARRVPQRRRRRPRPGRVGAAHQPARVCPTRKPSASTASPAARTSPTCVAQFWHPRTPSRRFAGLGGYGRRMVPHPVRWLRNIVIGLVLIFVAIQFVPYGWKHANPPVIPGRAVA